MQLRKVLPVVFMMLQSTRSFVIPVGRRAVRTGLQWGEKDMSSKGDEPAPFSFTKPPSSSSQGSSSGPSSGGRRPPPRSRVGGGAPGRRGPPQHRGGRPSGGRDFDRRPRFDRRKDGDDERGSLRRFREDRPPMQAQNVNVRAQHSEKQDDSNRINLRSLESAGYSHIYGLSPVLNALYAGRRNFEPEIMEDESIPEKVRPSPRLFVQEMNSESSSRTPDKVSKASNIIALANSLAVPVTQLDKGTMNSLTGNRPHQGYVLRSRELPLESTHESEIFTAPASPSVWIALDEVQDPQNLGAILRSAHFLGDVGVLVCGKNSAPLSPSVSAASAGAMEIIDIVSTNNLPKALDAAKDAGYQVYGAAAGPSSVSMGEEPSAEKVVLVMGSEGTGLRSLVSRSCDNLVAIPGAESEGDAGVDSLNVSVTAGIMLHHFLNKIKSM